jgi:hypothetical protein
VLSKFRRTSWKFQQTFAPDGERYEKLLPAVIKSLGEAETATVTIAEVNTGTPFLSALVGLSGESTTLERGTSIVAECRDEIAPLLDAALRDGNNFLFVPAPKPFVMYEDDGFATFFANNRSSLNLIAKPLETLGVKLIQGWQCRF